MNQIKHVLIVLFFALLCENLAAAGMHNGPGPLDPGELNATEESNLVFMREEEKLARDTYRTLYEIWKDRIFSNIAASEQRHMNAMKQMLTLYNIDDPVVSDEVGVFSDPGFDNLYKDFIERGDDSLFEALRVGAYVEELDIRDLRIAISNTDERPLLNAYTMLLAGARNHLRAFVAHLRFLEEGYVYDAQELPQSVVDQIVGEFVIPRPAEGFTINPGLNDVWYYPATPGQGFSISVFPAQKTVFLLWFTYDTVLPDADDSANLGDPGQRWLSAQGSYQGSEALLYIDVFGGGLFDSSEPLPSRTPDGTILLQFENCNSGSVSYDIPSIGQEGVVPIQRVNPENALRCVPPIGDVIDSGR